MYKNIEELSLNAWPAFQTYVYDGWLLRFADGFTKRSNSINPIYKANTPYSLEQIEDKIKTCESMYSNSGLNTVFKITPFINPSNLDNLLNQSGYHMLDLTSVQVTNLSEIEEPRSSQVEIRTEMNNEWLDTISRFNNLSDAQAEITRKLWSNSFLRRGFFTLYSDTIPVACGAGVIEQDYVGLYDIVTDPSYRNQGYGRELLLHILKWAKGEGATHSYLQVVKDNLHAMRLYGSIGYEEIYTYWYRQKNILGK